MSKVVHFEIQADKPERAVKFYTDVFGWKIGKWGGQMEYWLADTGEKDEPGINGAIMPREHKGVSTINTIGVPSIDDAIKKVKKAGGKVMGDKMPIPGIGMFVYCQDTEGNLFGILQPEMKGE